MTSESAPAVRLRRPTGAFTSLRFCKLVNTKRVLTLFDVMVREAARKQGVDPADVRFTRREVRERLGVGSTQAWVHLRRLIEGEYLLVHPSRRGRGVVFELALEPSRMATSSGVAGASSDVPSGEVREQLLTDPNNTVLLVSRLGDGLTPGHLTMIVGRHVKAANIGKTGSSHLFRHAMATLMLEGGADSGWFRRCSAIRR